MPKKSRRRNKRKKSRTRKKRGAVKYKKTKDIMPALKKTIETKPPERFGKNKTTDDIVKEIQKRLNTPEMRLKRRIRDKLIKSTGKRELALFKKQALNQMRITFQKTFGQDPSDNDRKILTLVYKSLKEPLSKAEEDYINKYRAAEEKNKKKHMWMNNYLRQLKEKSQLEQFKIYKHGDNPEALLKYRSKKPPPKRGKATDLVINADPKYMSPVKGPDTRYPELSEEIGNRGKNLFNNKRQEDPKEIANKGKNLFQKSQQVARKEKGGRRTRRKRHVTKRRRTRKKNRR